MCNVQTCKISADRYLFFDIFYIGGEIIVILPIYNSVVSIDEIEVDGELVRISEKLVKNSYEPICIYKYAYVSDSETICVKIGDDFTCKLDAISVAKTNSLALTTLFKDDYRLFAIFYDYYVKQGVSHFYMYYNGVLTDEIRSVVERSGVTLIEWDFHYWNDLATCKYKHHAQMGQMNHALYRYGGQYSHMIFCDMDEYMCVDGRLVEFIYSHCDVDVFGFHTVWADTMDGLYPCEFPSEIRIGEKFRYNVRSKNIYKTSSVSIVGVHSCMHYTKERANMMYGLNMFHFYNWSGVDRKETCDKIYRFL
jgi:hypothetical protein